MTDENCCCVSIVKYLEDKWDEYKHHSGKVSIALSIAGAVSAILAGKLIIAGAIALTITNTAIFFSGIAYEKLTNENKNLKTDNESLQNENRRMTSFKFPPDQPNGTPRTISQSSTQTMYEEVVPFKPSHEPHFAFNV